MAELPSDVEIDQGAAVASKLLSIASTFVPILRFLLPFLQLAIAHEASRLKKGLSDGTLVPDGRGGCVPSTNSRVRPDGSLY